MVLLQWPWVTPNPDSKATPLFDAEYEYPRNGTRYSHCYNGILICPNTSYTQGRMTLRDVAKYSVDTNHRAASLRQLSFLSLFLSFLWLFGDGLLSGITLPVCLIVVITPPLFIDIRYLAPPVLRWVLSMLLPRLFDSRPCIVFGRLCL